LSHIVADYFLNIQKETVVQCSNDCAKKSGGLKYVCGHYKHMIKVAVVKELAFSDSERLHSVLNDVERHTLLFHLWDKSKRKPPEVRFSLAHNGQYLFLKFFVEEQEIRARVMKTNGPVWGDSCVEFFVSFDESGYYNFEFNCIGTVLGAFGKSRSERTFLPERSLGKIATATKLNRSNGNFSWEIAITLPVEVFIHHSFQSINGVTCKGNFYKCGDELSEPHYLSWKNIESNEPNFHLPQFFSEIVFE
jgi:hypothetical protein